MSTSVSSLSTNFFPQAQNGFTTTLASTIASGATTVPLNSVAGYTNASPAVFIVDPSDASKKQTFTGIIDTSGVQVTSVVWTAGTNQTHSGGATIVDYPAATHIDMIQKGLLITLSQDGTLKSNLSITSPTLQGLVDGWIGANESWVYTSSTTITVPTDATLKYDIGDLVKITQSATIKYFVIISLTSTVLTVTGLGGVTVANSAITANAYSKQRNPHSAVAGAQPINPYKFSVYRSAALNWTANVALPFDTKTFDTSSNVDIVTNKGRFTAPVSGFYYLKTSLTMSINTQANTAFGVALYKNGSVMDSGSAFVNMYNSNYSITFNASDFQQLTAGDYVEVWNTNNPNGQTMTVGASNCNFKGFLVSLI